MKKIIIVLFIVLIAFIACIFIYNNVNSQEIYLCTKRYSNKKDNKDCTLIAKNICKDCDIGYNYYIEDKILVFTKNQSIKIYDLKSKSFEKELTTDYKTNLNILIPEFHFSYEDGIIKGIVYTSKIEDNGVYDVLDYDGNIVKSYYSFETKELFDLPENTTITNCDVSNQFYMQSEEYAYYGGPFLRCFDMVLTSESINVEKDGIVITTKKNEDDNFYKYGVYDLKNKKEILPANNISVFRTQNGNYVVYDSESQETLYDSKMQELMNFKLKTGYELNAPNFLYDVNYSKYVLVARGKYLVLMDYDKNEVSSRIYLDDIRKDLKKYFNENMDKERVNYINDKLENLYLSNLKIKSVDLSIDGKYGVFIKYVDNDNEDIKADLYYQFENK